MLNTWQIKKGFQWWWTRKKKQLKQEGSISLRTNVQTIGIGRVHKEGGGVEMGEALNK